MKKLKPKKINAKVDTKIKSQYWIIKSEPAAYSWSSFLEEKIAHWDGVRNYQARNNLSKMKVGDLAFFYHSVTERKVVGVAKVIKEAYPDTTTDDPRWVMVDFKPVMALKNPVSLDLIKEVPELGELKLVKQGRLSVSEITKKEFKLILKLGQTIISFA